MNLIYGLQQGRRGWLAALASDRGLRAISMPQVSPEAALDNLGRDLDKAFHDDSIFEDLFSRIDGYLNGDPVTFAEDAVDPELGTNFQRQVWAILRTIPYGETRSYGWVAGQMGMPQAPRAVGRAIGSNRVVLVVPCQRVIGAAGDLRGYGAGGIDVKRHLLELERAGSQIKMEAP